jgi:hypothetical protein
VKKEKKTIHRNDCAISSDISHFVFYEKHLLTMLKKHGELNHMETSYEKKTKENI